MYRGRISPGDAAAVASHADADETIYVISGTGRLPDGTEVGPGTCIHLPAGTPHGVSNPGPDPLEVVAIVHPR
jgi:mannose-6-phosphate isomerase-like protein (cupin superfamily)